MVLNGTIWKTKMRKGNPTAKTQQEIYETIRKSKTPMSLTAIAVKTNKTIYQVKSVVDFLEQLNVIKRIVSSGGTTFVQVSHNEI